ncbi:MAG: PEP-CTERM sorting domain-containing protein [Nitrospira sp.]|nr:PEP-CTERM sorting domain-containing protein [bacterium]MBL7048532.1 PEP-CTERM sorting domain-containing protein [Nitrospira sp.]
MVVVCFVLSLGMAFTSSALIYDVTIDGSDAIFIAGRTDVPIPALDGNPNAYILRRHGFITPEAIVETLPPVISVVAGDVVKVADAAVGGVSFFNGVGAPFFGPGGNGVSGSNLSSLGGISGYIGPQGPLTGVFLNNNIPNIGPAPATLDFSLGGLGINFLSLTPGLGQIFYIGDGLTDAALFQSFTAPVGATRLFLGIPDGFGFVGVPGAYDDNDGAYRVRIGVNETPIIPEPSTVLLLGSGLIAAVVLRRKISG